MANKTIEGASGHPVRMLFAAKVKQFRDAIGKSYWFEFFIDDLPLWGFVAFLIFTWTTISLSTRSIGFSIFNSFMMVIFLTGLVSMILMRTLRNDYAKYAREDDDLETLERDVSEESGWKLVHGDFFWSPRNLVLFSAVVGTGAQLAMPVLLVNILAIIGM
ncbi:Transmembrane 9 superfamily member 1 [Vitis vinifera]|uniref:Transmembrane 9 superfamily member n=1 Tax=Vitis vinifera TaxID=29760 RepID=A0A438J036_VITVI|nr:Transmembrane 9 superfamily member 1 [Vitis vinifera]